MLLSDELREALEAIVTNDTTPVYEYGQERKYDGASPPVSGRWLTPREIALDVLREAGVTA